MMSDDDDGGDRCYIARFSALEPGLEPETFRLRVRRSNRFVIPAPHVMCVSVGIVSAAATSTPANLLRHYYQTMGQAGQRRQRSEKKPIPDDQKDEKYFERRRRNNGAAKR